LVSPLGIALFVGIPAAVIVGLGFLLNTFRGTILGSARSVGEVFTGIFTEPISGAVEQISGAFSNLPDIDVRIPALNIGGGGITLFGEDIATSFENAINDIPDPLPEPTGRFERNRPGRGGGGTPIPRMEEVIDPLSREDLLPGSLVVSLSGGQRRLTRQEIFSQFPGTIALFDVLNTDPVEFLPFTQVGAEQSLRLGQDLRVSGQLFESQPGLNLLAGA